MTPEAVFDRALASTPLPDREGVPLDVYGLDHDGQAGAAAIGVAVRMARLGDEEACLLALQDAARKVFRYEEAA
jgi:hypothetical protein